MLNYKYWINRSFLVSSLVCCLENRSFDFYSYFAGVGIKSQSQPSSSLYTLRPLLPCALPPELTFAVFLLSLLKRRACPVLLLGSCWTHESHLPQVLWAKQVLGRKRRWSREIKRAYRWEERGGSWSDHVIVTEGGLLQAQILFMWLLQWL